VSDLATILEHASDEGSLRKPYAGNPHVRFDEEGGSGLPDLPYSTGSNPRTSKYEQVEGVSEY